MMGQNETSGTTEESFRFCRTVNRLTSKIREHSIDDFVRGMASQTAKSVSVVYDGDLTESFVYGATYPRANLQQIDLQRAAEYELNSYDNVRRGFMQLNGLEDDLPYGPFQEFYAAQARDFYTAGLLESSQDGKFGELFSTIIVEQFLRLRDADPEWFEAGIKFSSSKYSALVYFDP